MLSDFTDERFFANDIGIRGDIGSEIQKTFGGKKPSQIAEELFGHKTIRGMTSFWPRVGKKNIDSLKCILTEVLWNNGPCVTAYELNVIDCQASQPTADFSVSSLIKFESNN